MIRDPPHSNPPDVAEIRAASLPRSLFWRQPRTRRDWRSREGSCPGAGLRCPVSEIEHRPSSDDTWNKYDSSSGTSDPPAQCRSSCSPSGKGHSLSPP